MASPFESLRFHVSRADKETIDAVGTRSPTMRGVGRPRAADENTPTFNNDETAARYFLSQLLARDARPALRGFRAVEQPDVIPNLRVTSVEPVQQTRTRLVKFEQVQGSVPVFGSNAVVELDQERELVSMNADLAEIRGVSPVARISAAEALERIAAFTNAQLDIALLNAPQLVYFHAEKDGRWHLAYFCRSVPAAPREFLEEATDRTSRGHGIGSSPRERYPKLSYLVDAHDGTILNYYSATPMVSDPTRCSGLDENGAKRTFYAIKTATQEFQLEDTVRSLKTFDLAGNVLDDMTPVPANPIRHNAYDWATQHRAAVSAHANAARVYHFYSSVLYRDSVDDKGMELLSVVNCTTDDPNDPPPEWHNATWWRDVMWYGQTYEAAQLRSWARYLDVIAHELTHGVTERTAGLIYQGQSGALDESFSDIFGIIIGNWSDIGDAEPATVANWVWELGSGLGGGGLPLRDLSDPARTSDPDHMDGYKKTSKDNGGVHTNSNIHNKAAYNVLTSKDAAGNYLFTPRDAANLYYLTLRRLGSVGTFKDARENLITVTESYYPDPVECGVRLAAIRDAYDRVGIV